MHGWTRRSWDRRSVTVTGPSGKKDLEACWELGALLAAEVAG
jgi:hypothetical protein